MDSVGSSHSSHGAKTHRFLCLFSFMLPTSVALAPHSELAPSPASPEADTLKLGPLPGKHYLGKTNCSTQQQNNNFSKQEIHEPIVNTDSKGIFLLRVVIWTRDSQILQHIRIFLEGLLKCQSWFNESGVGPKMLHVQQVPRWCWFADEEPHLGNTAWGGCEEWY